MTLPLTADWFSTELDNINSDLNGALGELTEAEVQVAKTALIAVMRKTISANPAGFKEMLSRLAPHPDRVAAAGDRAMAP